MTDDLAGIPCDDIAAPKLDTVRLLRAYLLTDHARAAEIIKSLDRASSDRVCSDLARPWVCLLCPLAVFTPRHAGNLLRLKAFFTRQWQQMTAAQFAAVFGPFHVRLLDILDRYEPAVLDQAASTVADADSEIPLRAEETTQPTQESA